MGNQRITLKQAAQWCGGSVAPEFEAVTFSGANFDTRRLAAGELFVAIVGERDGHDFVPAAMEKGAAAVLASRPLAQTIPAIYVEDTVTALQAVAREWRESLSFRSVGITGSVGKTTTKEMTAAVLETTYRTCYTAENFNNGLGLPVTVLGIPEDCQAAVLEMGMNHFGEISLLTAIAQPELAVITNVGTMHIENLGSREGILRAKLEILEGLRPGGTAVFNGDNDLLAAVADRYHAVTFGMEEHNTVRAVKVEEFEDEIHFSALAFGQELPVILPVAGKHNVYNALAAITVGLLSGVSPENIQKALAGFHNTGMRQNRKELGSWHILEDCYNAGPESMGAALEVLAQAGGRRIAVLGGMLELGDFAPGLHYEVGRKAAAVADLLFAYGEQAQQYVLGAKAAGLEQAWYFDTHEALAQSLKEKALPGDTILVKGSRGMRMERVLQLLDTTDGGKHHG